MLSTNALSPVSVECMRKTPETRAHRTMSLNISMIMITSKPMDWLEVRYLKMRHQMSSRAKARSSTEPCSETKRASSAASVALRVM